jgi:hypothetical protein
VNDTNVYAIAGNRLYYLSNDRGLLAFDVTDVDHPVLLGNTPMSGDPQAIYVDGNLVVVVFGDWYETTPQGLPFHGSVVRAMDCTDPTHIRVAGEVRVDGYIQDSRLVGDVLYTVGTDRGLTYGAAWQAVQASPQAVVTSIALNGGAALKLAEQTIPGDGGVFAFAPGAILVSTVAGTTPATTLQYVDVSDPSGTMALRGAITLDGIVGTGGAALAGYCTNTGGWALDFTDGVHAHAVTTSWPFGMPATATLTTVDFSNAAAPTVSSVLPGLMDPGDDQGVVPRFDVDPTVGRALLFIAHSGMQSAGATPLDVYDLSSPGSPGRVGATSFSGDICTLQPSGNLVFTVASFEVDNGAWLDLRDLDFTDPASPKLLGSTTVPTSARDIFPAVDAPGQVTLDATGTLALVPFTINSSSGPNTFGLEVVTLGSSSLAPMGMAPVSDPIQRGIFVEDRAYAFSDEALAVFDLTNPAAPRQTAQLTFAPYVSAAQPLGSTIAELSSNFYAASSPTDVRLVPIAGANDASAWAAATSAKIPAMSAPAVSAEVFQNGSMLYVSTTTCPYSGCVTNARQVSVVDVSTGAPVTRGSVQLAPITPDDPYGPYSPTYYGWYTGPDVVQVASSTLAVRPLNLADPLQVVDLSNPDAPTVSSVQIASPDAPWWGNLQLIGLNLYATTFESLGGACGSRPTPDCTVAYYLVPVDLHDPANPIVGSPVSVPGILFGASAEDPATLYLSNYVWGAQRQENDVVSVCKLSGGHCLLQGTVQLGGVMGPPFVQNDKAYITVYAGPGLPGTELHQLDLTNPQSPVDTIVQTPFARWGSLLAVSGDVALITSGWSSGGADVNLLNGTAPPVYRQTMRDLFWSSTMVTRQGSTVYVVGGPWGVQPIDAP